MTTKILSATTAPSLPEEPQSRREIDAEHAACSLTHLDYIQDMVSELQRMSQQQGWHVLVAALDVVILAAAQQKRLIR